MIEKLEPLDIQSIPNPEVISPAITLIDVNNKDRIIFSGPDLYNLSRDGPIGAIIKLAPNVKNIEITDISPDTSRALMYLASQRIIPPDEKKRLDTASRYFLIDDLANPIVQDYLYCEGVNEEIYWILSSYIQNHIIMESISLEVYYSRNILIQC